MNMGRTGKYFLIRLLRLRGNPHTLALGAAIGVFIGVTPTIPLHTAAILALTLATRSSFLAGIITSWLVSNPLTYLPLYYFALRIGNLVTPYELSWSKIQVVLETVLSDVSLATRLQPLMSLGYEAIIVMVAGGFLLALPAGVASYYAFYFMFVKIRKKRHEKRILR